MDVYSLRRNLGARLSSESLVATKTVKQQPFVEQQSFVDGAEPLVADTDRRIVEDTAAVTALNIEVVAAEDVAHILAGGQLLGGLPVLKSHNRPEDSSEGNTVVRKAAGGSQADAQVAVPDADLVGLGSDSNQPVARGNLEIVRDKFEVDKTGPGKVGLDSTGH